MWVDEPAALDWLAPGYDTVAGLRVMRWVDGDEDEGIEPADIDIEAFGCHPPEAFVARMAQRATPPLWINLEYLSAEPFVERCHGLPSPQSSGPGRGLRKWFFYPGFTPSSGGLLREPELPSQRRNFDAAAWLHSRGIVSPAHERRVSLFCYDTAPVLPLIAALADRPTLLLLTPGPAQRLVHAALRGSTITPMLRCIDLDWLTQPDYDRLLWSCTLNFVRGEDSFVRAQWAGAPFVWQICAQHDSAHVIKLEAFMARHLTAAEPALADSVAALWRAWNGLTPWPAALPDRPAWQSHALDWRHRLEAQPDLVSRLRRFVAERR
jgi:uncharacterized repeat protein (TIGR03837 family)